MISELLKAELDSLDKELLLAYLSLRYGHYEPIWKECSKEEYEKNNIQFISELTNENFNKVLRTLFSSHTAYKVNPIYKNADGGLLFQMEQHEPIRYEYYKKVGEKFVILLNSDMFDYCSSRKDIKEIIESM